MGIPSYFSYILKNHNVITKLQRHYDDNNHHILLMDCNSIIYNVIHTHKLTNSTEIISNVCEEIQRHIRLLNPSHLCVIAFDGVAPFAKMKQQCDRRYKSAIFQTYESSSPETKYAFDKANITPGTVFMDTLSKKVKHYFSEHKFECTVKVTGSDDAGEGEHKLFEFIREYNTYCAHKNICIYGLDSDLIILSLEHLCYTNNIILYRDALFSPKSSINITNQKNKKDFDVINMRHFSDSIYSEISKPGEQTKEQRLTDYVALSFFLGNDFMPHSPILPIRTFGIYELLRVYNDVCDDHHKYITKNKMMHWKIFKNMCFILSKRQNEFIKKEIKHLTNLSKRNQRKEQKEKEVSFQDILCTFQPNILLIEPDYPNWESRYYQYLFLSEPTPEFIKTVCLSYLQGFEWCLAYYTNKCIDHTWHYPYYYPPLFSDLLKYIPEFNNSLFSANNNQNKHLENLEPLEQLAYVLPPTSYNLLPLEMKQELLEYNDKNTLEQNNIHNVTIQPDFSTFMWETHPIRDTLPLEFVRTVYNKYKYKLNNSTNK
jgi:5'-3' exoribonuclease 1